MKKKKPKANPIINIIVTMRLAKAIDCSYEVAALKIKVADKAAN